MNSSIKKVLFVLVVLIVLIFLNRIDVPFDSFSRNYTFLGVPYQIMQYISLLGRGELLIALVLLFLIAGLLSDAEKTIQLALQLSIALILTGIFISLFKLCIGRVRPMHPNQGEFVLFPPFQAAFQSFPSGHTGAAFTVAAVLANAIPGSGVLLYLLAALVGVSRMYTHVHFASDVFAGALVGLVMGKLGIRISAWDVFSRIHVSNKTAIALILLIILLISGYLFFFSLGTFGLFDLDEPAFAEATREMLGSGNWITPYMNYELRFDKPILIYWLMAGAYALFGITEFAARFWSAFFGTVNAFLIFWFGKKWKDTKFGLISSMIFLTCVEIMVLGHAAITDMTLLFFLTISLLSFYLGYLSNFGFRISDFGFINSAIHNPQSAIRNGSRWYWLFYIGIAFATLTKGLIGIVLPVTIIFLFLISTRQLRSTIKEMKIVPGILVFLIITLPWYILVIHQNGWVFVQKFLIYHHFERYTSPVSGHSGNPFYYILVILFGFFPWSCFLLSGIKSAIPWNFRKWKDISRQGQFPLYCLIWVGVIFFFFTISKTKLPNYAAPLFPPITFLTAVWWYHRITEKENGRTSLKFVSSFLLILGIMLAIAFAIVPSIIKNLAESGKLVAGESIQFGIVPYLITLMVLIGVISSFISLIKQKYVISFILLVGMMLSLWYLIVTGLVPVVYEYQQRPLYQYATSLRNEMQPNDQLVEFGLNYPSVIFYSHHPIIRLGNNDVAQLQTLLQSSERVYVISSLKFLPNLEPIPEFKVIQKDGQYLLGSNLIKPTAKMQR